MRIAFVKQKYVRFGGGEGYLCRLMEACRQRGDEVHLITTEWNGSDESSIILHSLSRKGITLGGRSHKFSQGAAEIVTRENFDLVVSLERTEQQDVWRAGEGVHRIWLERRREFQPWYKTALNEYSPRHRALLQLEEECVRNTPLIIANSKMVKRDIERVYGKDSAAIKVIYNGVDPDCCNVVNRQQDRKAIRSKLGIEGSVPLLLFAGSGFERKGLRESLKMLALLPDCRLLVMGRDDPARWKKYAARLGVSERVRFMPPQRELQLFFHAADITLLPSWFDPFPNVGLESLFCGTPLLTSAYAGVHEVVQEISGAVVSRPSDVQSLASNARKLLRLTQTQGHAEKVSATVKDFTIENNRERTLDAIHAFC